jgi:hypothetical protein
MHDGLNAGKSALILGAALVSMVLERIPKGRNRGGFPNQVELWFILAAGLEASRDGEAFF